MDLVTLRLLAAVSRIAAILPNDLAPTIMNGPKLPFIANVDAAMQLHQTGHSLRLRNPVAGELTISGTK